MWQSMQGILPPCLILSFDVVPFLLIGSIFLHAQSLAVTLLISQNQIWTHSHDDDDDDENDDEDDDVDTEDDDIQFAAGAADCCGSHRGYVGL